MKVFKGQNIFSAHEFEDVIVAVGWSKRGEMSLEGLSKAIESSTQMYCLRNDQDKIIALARILSDNYIFSTIPEILVLPEFQKKGLGTALVNEIIKDFGHTILYFGAQNGNETFFEKFGFVKGPQAYTKKFFK